MKRLLGPCMLLICLLLIAPAGAGAKTNKVKTASVPVTFTVRNTDTSQFACTSDGGTYQIKGHITGPSSALASTAKKKKKKRSKSATLYLHGLGVGEWLWNFTAIPSFNYALQQAKAGHVSVTIDRLGYGASSHPPDGNQVCIGSEADIAHQVVQALKSGSYAVGSGKPVKYKRIALAGHSAAGEISVLEAYSYKDVSALIVVSFSFSNLPAANIAFGNQRNACQAPAPVPVAPGVPVTYQLFGQTPAEFQQTFFHSATKAVRDAATPLHNPDPCGDNLSLTEALNKQAAGAGKIKVPALEVCGANDVLYARFGCESQLARFGSRDKQTIIIKNAGHGLPVEKPAGTFRQKLGAWLSRRGF